MCLYKINYSEAPDDKKHIEIINNSNTTLTNLKLFIDSSLADLVECTVVRERGSLAFSSPVNLIELGNLLPNESAHFYCTFKSISPLPDSQAILKQFQLHCDMPGQKKPPHSDLVTCLAFYTPNNLSS